MTGSIVPNPGYGPGGLQCTMLLTSTTVDILRLILAAPGGDPGQPLFASMVIGGLGTFASASATASTSSSLPGV